MSILKTVLLLLVAVLALCSVNVAEAADGQKKGDMAAYHKRTGAKYLAEVAQRPEVHTLKSGMLVEILKTSDNPDAKSPNKGDSCEVTYAGTLKDGTPFDKGTTSFAPNQVIKGWTEAMQLMGEGDKWKLYIPYDLAYGERGSPPKIPGYAPLVFEIEIHKVKKGGKPIAEARQMFEEAVVKKEEL
jgi:FKBP-type peptidyl-prolyl cis-trans isomerase FklB